MRRYVVALKRGASTSVSLAECLSAEPGVRVTGDRNSVRVQIEATDEAIDQLRAKIGDWCYIEPMIIHRAVG